MGPLKLAVAVGLCGLAFTSCSCGSKPASSGGADDAGLHSPSDGGSSATPTDGGSGCVPRSCADWGYDCGPAGDGCGGALDCGTCTAPNSCGGGGTRHKCGGTTTACVPKTCAQLGLDCGSEGDGCGGSLSCGSCTAPAICGGSAPGHCGGAVCVPHTCAQLGFNCGPEGDGCGGILSCGSCTAPDICGGGGSPGVCGGVVVDGGTPCVNLCPKQVACDGGPTTTITGRVVAPGHDDVATWGAPDPIYNALVYVPNGTVQPFKPGVACLQCEAASGSALVSTSTAYDGTFTLTNVPAATSFPVVVQLGRWRRQFDVGPATACQSLAVGDLRLPRDHTEGDIPQFAVATGAVDTTECVLRKIGIADSEFSSSAGSGRIKLYPAYDAAACTGTAGQTGAPTAGAQDACYLTSHPDELGLNDMIIFSCVGAPVTQAAGDLANLKAYTNGGGRVFATHYSYVWMAANAPWDGAAHWSGDNKNFGDTNQTVTVNQSTPKGVAFARWLKLVGASTTLGQVSVGFLRDNECGAIAPSQDWLDVAAPHGSPCRSTTNNVAVHLTFNTPFSGDPATQCGRALFSDFHVSNAAVKGQAFPSQCATAPLTAQEKVLEYMLFDLASCVVPDGPTPQCTPRTCAGLCGLTGDGCGGQLSCGACTAPATCGGGGKPSVCGPTCTPLTCAQQGFDCGPEGDGCGGSLDCGKCTSPKTCGGGGIPGACGVPSCTPLSCAQQGFDCGPAGDGCGGALQCGGCTPPATCGSGGPGRCGCTSAGGACTGSQDCCNGLVCFNGSHSACGPSDSGCTCSVPIN